MISTFKKNPPPKGIVCGPVSDTTPLGYAGKKLQFLRQQYVKPIGIVDGLYKLQPDESYAITPGADTAGDITVKDDNYIKSGIEVGITNDHLQGGNCYWVRPSDGLVISWDGPLGFYKAPEPQVSAVTALPGYGSNLTTVPGNPNVYSHSRWDTYVYCHGHRFLTPSHVLGATMIADNLIIVTRTNGQQDNVYITKIMSFDTDPTWDLLYVIPTPNSANKKYLDRRNIYAFSQDSLSFISLLDYTELLGVSPSLFQEVIRGSLTYDSLLDVVTVDSFTLTSHTGKVEQTTSGTNVVTTEFDVPIPGTASTGTKVTEVSSGSVDASVLDIVVCVGFIGNLELVMSPTLVASTGSMSNNSWNLTDGGGEDLVDVNFWESRSVVMDYNVDGFTLGSTEGTFSKTRLEVAQQSASLDIFTSSGTQTDNFTNRLCEFYYVNVPDKIFLYTQHSHTVNRSYTAFTQVPKDGTGGRDNDQAEDITLELFQWTAITGKVLKKTYQGLSASSLGYLSSAAFAEVMVFSYPVFPDSTQEVQLTGSAFVFESLMAVSDEGAKYVACQKYHYNFSSSVLGDPSPVTVDVNTVEEIMQGALTVDQLFHVTGSAISLCSTEDFSDAIMFRL